MKQIGNCFICDICGRISNDPEETAECEAQGIDAKFSKGDEVEFPWISCHRWLEAEVVEVGAITATHGQPWYRLRVSRKIYELMYPTKNIDQTGGPVFIGRWPEQHLRRPCPIIASYTRAVET